MNIDCVKTGFLKENCYILSINNDCIVIDPGDNYNLIKEKLKNKSVLAVLITHYHFDHIGALDFFKEEFKPIIIDYKSNFNQKIGPFYFEILKTKGHSSDSVTYYFKNDNIMFVGDFIFKESIGRCDFPTGNENEMKESLKKIKNINQDIILYPGHGDKTTLFYEKENNYYLKGDMYE